VEDLPDLVYKDPSLSIENASFSPCVQARQFGEAIKVTSLTRGRDDFYVLPFYKDNIVCAKAVIELNHNAAHISVFSSGDFGEKFPALDAEEAVKLVYKETGKEAVENPTLVYISVREYPNSISDPSWQVITKEGDTYYVVFSTGPVEEGYISTRVAILNATEVHEIN